MPLARDKSLTVRRALGPALTAKHAYVRGGYVAVALQQGFCANPRHNAGSFAADLSLHNNLEIGSSSNIPERAREVMTKTTRRARSKHFVVSGRIMTSRVREAHP